MIAKIMAFEDILLSFPPKKNQAIQTGLLA